MAAELSDAEVFGAPREMTDAQVFSAGRPPPPVLDDYGREVKTPAETPGVPIVGGNAPGYRQSDILPLARRQDVIDNPNSSWTEGWAFAPGPFRALGQTPAENTTIDPNTNTMNIAPEALTAATALGGVRGLPRFGAPEPVPPGLAAREAPLSLGFRENPLAPSAVAKIGETPAGDLVSGAPANQLSPGAVGADITSGPLPTLTKAEEMTNLQKSVVQSASDRAGPQMRDDTVYIPGVQRPLATREFTPQNAVDDKIFRETDPVYRARAEKLDLENNNVMKDAILAHAGDPNSLAAAYQARSAVAPDAMGVFRNEQPISAEPLISAVDELLASPAGRRGAVARTLNNVRSTLTREGDDPAAMAPSQVYGARQNITDLLQKGATGSGDEAKDIQAAKALLQGLLPTFDAAIAEGAPRYSDYMSEFRRLSQPINQQEFLQKYLTGTGKITNDQGMLLPTRVQRMLDDVYKGQSAGGANRTMSLTPEAVSTIEGVRNELAYNALRDRNASVKGSDTFQKINQAGILGAGPVGTFVRAGAEAAAHLALAPLTGGVGNVLLSGFTKAQAARTAAREAARLGARKEQLLDTGGAQPN